MSGKIISDYQSYVFIKSSHMFPSNPVVSLSSTDLVRQIELALDFEQVDLLCS